jgi:hypothetical protein
MENNDTLQQISWETLNLCIGSIFELIEQRRNFSTADVAAILQMNGVTVTNWPADVAEKRLPARV